MKHKNKKIFNNKIDAKLMHLDKGLFDSHGYLYNSKFTETNKRGESINYRYLIREFSVDDISILKNKKNIRILKRFIKYATKYAYGFYLDYNEYDPTFVLRLRLKEKCE